MSKNPENRRNSMKISNTNTEFSKLLNNLRNFNEIFIEDVTDDNIKFHTHKKIGFHSLFMKWNEMKYTLFNKIYNNCK